MDSENRWAQKLRENPDHSQWYIQRFRDMAEQGKDLDGEARLIDAMATRGSRILDAGCGPGRVGGALHERGHLVVGVDLDPALIAAAQKDQPGPSWLVGDLAVLDLDGLDLGWASEGFDLIVCAGNVVSFLAPRTRQVVLANLGKCLAPEGRLVVGFSAGRDYSFDEFREDVAAGGFRIIQEFATWELHPLEADSDFLVAVIVAADTASGPRALRRKPSD